MARKYEFYFWVAKQYFTNELSEWVKYCFCHEKIKFISSSRRAMFFLLYRQKNIDKIIEGNYRNYVIDKTHVWDNGKYTIGGPDVVFMNFTGGIFPSKTLVTIYQGPKGEGGGGGVFGRSPGALIFFFPWSPEPYRFVAWIPNIREFKIRRLRTKNYCWTSVVLRL